MNHEPWTIDRSPLTVDRYFVVDLVDGRQTTADGRLMLTPNAAHRRVASLDHEPWTIDRSPLTVDRFFTVDLDDS